MKVNTIHFQNRKMRRMRYKIRFTIGLVILLLGAALCPIKSSAEQYYYDSMGRVCKVLYEDGSYDIYDYDKNGNIKSVKHFQSTSETCV